MIAGIIAPAQTAPIRRRATYEEYLAAAGESRIVEWVDEEIIEYMPPSIEHQDLAGFLLQLVGLFVARFSLGKVLMAPTEVKLWSGGPSREPDIFFVSAANLSSFDKRRFNGAPDLVIEVVSPGSVREDRVRKFTEYEQAGVREYWLVDPRPHQCTVECYRRDEAGVFAPVDVTEDGRLHSAVLTHGGASFWLHVDWLWQEPLPKTATALQQILDSDERFAQ